MSHSERFNGRVDDYDRYRMRYPAAMLEVIYDRCGLQPDDVVADIGAGTGMVAELFLGAGHRVLAVEPNAEMRAAYERLTGLKAIAATAEETGLASGSVNLVAVGRAFHWFDQTRALAEFARILKPGGWVTLFTNRRALEGEPRTAQYEALLLQHGSDYAAIRKRYTHYEQLNPYGGEHFRWSMPGEQRLTLDALLGQTQSLSIAPKPGEPGYEGMQRALREFFAHYQQDGLLRLETVSEMVGWRTPPDEGGSGANIASQVSTR